MKKQLLITTLCVVLTGCATAGIEIRTVEVPKPIPFIPAPPEVPKQPPNGFLVDKLTDQDLNDPGKVAQSYKYDMLWLREINEIYIQILELYKSGSQDLEKTKILIDQLYQKMQEQVKKQNETNK